MSVRRRSECHETKRCSCRFGSSSSAGGGAVVVGSPGTAAGGSTAVSARCRCGGKGDGGVEEGDGEAAGGRVDEPNDDGCGCGCRVSGKDVHGGEEGSTDRENVVLVPVRSSPECATTVAGPRPPAVADADACGGLSSPAAAATTEPKANEDDERPRACGNGGCEGCASTSDAGPRA